MKQVIRALRQVADNLEAHQDQPAVIQRQLIHHEMSHLKVQLQLSLEALNILINLKGLVVAADYELNSILKGR